MNKYSFVMAIFVTLFLSTMAYAQVSERLASAAVGHEVTVELLEGEPVAGHLEAVDGGAVIIRNEQGQLSEYSLEEVKSIAVTDMAQKTRANEETAETEQATPSNQQQAKSSPQTPSAKAQSEVVQDSKEAADDWISRREYLVAKSRRKAGKNLKIVGLTALSVGIGTLIAGSIARKKANDTGCNDYSYNTTGGCKDTLNAVSAALFGMTPFFVGGGTTLAIIGANNANRAEVDMELYELQRQETSRQPLQKKTVDVTLAPSFQRDGGGLQMGMRF